MTDTDARKERARQIATNTVGKWGHRSAVVASDLHGVRPEVTSTGILALDYMTGIGGWPKGYPVECFGPPDLGKSTIIGLGGIREAQKAGMLCGLIAMEPHFKEEWAIKQGVDPDLLVVTYPDNGEDAFAILYDWVSAGVPDFIVFDSIGALSTDSKAAEEGRPKAYGASGIISSGLTNIAPKLYKNDVSLILLNQVRDDTQSKMPGLLDSPGGWALRHLCPLRIQLRPGKDRYNINVPGIDGSDTMLIGRKVIASIKRNKLAENVAPGRKAQFDFYHYEADGEPFGLDVAEDVKNTGIVTGVIQKKGAWLYHDLFPNGKINGGEKLSAWIEKNPDAVPKIREEILATLHG